MKIQELLTLGVSTDLRTANRALGISDSQGYKLAASGDYPVPVIRAGGRYIVPTAGLLAALGVVEASATRDGAA